MLLSYTSRLICLALCSAGILQLALEWTAWVVAPRLVRHSSRANTRRTEQSTFMLILFARLSPWLVVLGAWLPAYMRGEDNLSPEHVGLVPVVAASCFFVFWLLGGVRLVSAWITTRHYCRQCRPAGKSPEGLPLLLHPGPQPLLAVAGLFRPRIIVSQSLLAPEKFSTAALAVAYLHESAHARHRDNLKRAVLTLIPHIPLATTKKPSLDQHWLLAAEMAADEAGAMGIPERSFLLADLLVKMARESVPPTLHGAFSLLSRADDLRARIERLLPTGGSSPCGSCETTAGFAGLRMLVVLAIASAALASLCCLGMQAGHRLSELLLHLG